jgi:hypothetical protein
MWLDDMRPAPPGWTHVKNVYEAKLLLLTGEVEFASLDHDLGMAELCLRCTADDDGNFCTGCQCECHDYYETAPTGYDLVKWMAETGIWSNNRPTVHSANPVGRDNMIAVIDRYFPS